MPELPEVETTRRGIEPYVQQQTVKKIIVRNPNLRWPVPANLAKLLKNQTIKQLQRRSKYLIFSTDKGHMLLHLGMSGSLRITDANGEVRKHDHVDFVFDNDKILRFHDPRRFGSIHWTTNEPAEHKLLAAIGPEPLERSFNGKYLFQQSRKRQVAVKNFIMNAHTVAGVGNIYASESLFLAGIRPQRKASSVTLQEYTALAKTIKQVLRHSIKMGGTTLRDFLREDGKPGYFRQKLRVYERAGETCVQCDSKIKMLVLGQRASYYCPSCQK